MRTVESFTVDGRELSFSNLEKVLYPAAGFTKGGVIDYYARIADAMLPHLRDRAMTFKRYPNGVDGMFFFEKNCPKHRPDWVQTAKVWSKHRGAHMDFCLINDRATLMWAANLAVLEFHSQLALKKNQDCPTVLVFDLDPGEGCTIVDCCEIALVLQKELQASGLESFPKTSGSKGLQLYAPLNTPTTFDATKTFSLNLAMKMEAEMPERVLHKMAKALRKGKIFIDWSQNDQHKTTVAVYSLRAKDRPTVSTPVDWKDVKRITKIKRPEELAFTSDEVLKRVDKFGDLFEPVLKLKQKLR
jgi:bifunctional non-homologous end joining protein LigD